MKITKSEIILIDNVLSNPKKFTRKSFIEKLENEGLPCSASSVTRILKNIKEEFDIRIKFSKNGFCKINDYDIDQNFIDEFQNYKNLFFRNTLQKSITENSIQKQFINFGFTTINKNIELLEPILNSIIESKIVKIYYKKFQEDTIKEYLVNPLFIKEYLNRWYVIGDTEKIKKRVFALDRIEKIDFLNQQYKKENNTQTDIYSNTIGVNFSEKVEKVVLWVSEKQYNYFETLPLHKTQQLIEKTTNGFIISLEVCCNYELEQWILHYGNTIKVVEPQKLKEKIKMQLLETLKNYEK